jgi:hypothetical protein
MNLTPRLDVGIGAWNQELEFAGTNTIVWMSLELEIGNVSEYRVAFASLSPTLEQIGAPRLGITMHSLSHPCAARPLLPRSAGRATIPLPSPARHPPSPSAGRPHRPPTPSLRDRRPSSSPSRPVPFLFLAAGVPPPLPVPHGGRRCGELCLRHGPPPASPGGEEKKMI